MMGEDYWIELGRRAVAAGCGWAPGMLDMEGWRIGGWTLHDGAHEAMKGGQHRLYHYPKIPDLRDPATVGCLLARVREAWGDKWLHVRPCTSVAQWNVDGAEVGRMCFGDTTRYFCGTEAASLVAALENAPPRKG